MNLSQWNFSSGSCDSLVVLVALKYLPFLKAVFWSPLLVIVSLCVNYPMLGDTIKFHTLLCISLFFYLSFKVYLPFFTKVLSAVCVNKPYLKNYTLALLLGISVDPQLCMAFLVNLSFCRVFAMSQHPGAQL